MAVSPLHYRYWSANTRPDTPAMALGRAVHMAVLEPRRFESLQDTPRKGTNRQRNAPTVRQIAAGIAKSVWKSCAGRYLICADTEMSVFWKKDCIGCKARVDAIQPGHVIELKTTRSLVEFHHAVRRYHYDAQLAWYCDALGFDKATIIAVETQPPYDVAICEVPRAILERGREKYRGWWSKLVECTRLERWPGVGEIRLDDDDIDMVGIDE